MEQAQHYRVFSLAAIAPIGSLTISAQTNDPDVIQQRLLSQFNFTAIAQIVPISDASRMTARLE
jgi:hypothetical protein